MEVHKQGHEVVLVCNKDAGSPTQKALFILPRLVTLSGETSSKLKGSSAVRLMPNARKSLCEFHS